MRQEEGEKRKEKRKKETVILAFPPITKHQTLNFRVVDFFGKVTEPANFPHPHLKRRVR
jgi:hypothetical protein